MVKRSGILFLLFLFFHIVTAQTSRKDIQLKLDTLVFLGKKDFQIGIYFQKELAYDYFDSKVYYLSTTDFVKGSITIHTYDQKLQVSDSLVCFVDPVIFSSTLAPYPRKLVVNEKFMVIKFYDHLAVISLTGKKPELIRYTKSATVPNHIHILSDSTIVMAESNMEFGGINSAFGKLTIYDFKNDHKVAVNKFTDISSYSWFALSDARVCSQGNTIWYADKWMQYIKLFNHQLEVVDSIGIPAFHEFNKILSKKKSVKLIRSLDTARNENNSYYDTYRKFFQKLYHVRDFYPLNDSVFFIVYNKTDHDTHYELFKIRNNAFISLGIQKDHNPSNKEVLTRDNIHNILTPRTLLIKDNKIIVMEYHPKSYPLGKTKGTFYEETLVTGQQVENCQLAVYIFSADY